MALSPLLGLTLPYDGGPNNVTDISSFLLALEAVLAGAAYQTPVPITGATVLTSSAFFKAHVCTGTSADYTVTLPTPASADVGKLLAFRMGNGLTKLVTLDAGATRSIDGSQTRVMWKDETCLLLCVATSGACWVKVSGKSLPHNAQMYMSANQSIPNNTFPPSPMLQLDTVKVDSASLCDTVNKWIRIRRAGTYRLVAQAYHDVSGAAYGMAVYVFSDPGTGVNTLQYTGVETTPAITTQVSAQAAGQLPCAAGLRLKLGAYQNSGGAKNVLGDAVSQYTFLSVEEILSW